MSYGVYLKYSLPSDRFATLSGQSGREALSMFGEWFVKHVVRL